MSGRNLRIVYAVNSGFAYRHFISEEVAKLGKDGHQVFVLVPDEADVEDCQPLNVQILRIPVRREIAVWSDIRTIFRILWAIVKIRPDVLNATTPKMGLLATLAARVCRVPARIYTLRGLRFEGAQGLLRGILQFAEKVACGSANTVLCISGSVRKELVGHNLVEPQKTVLLNKWGSDGIDVARFTPTESRLEAARRLRCDLGFEPSDIVYGFVGRLNRDKGIIELLRAFEQVVRREPRARLLVLGGLDRTNPLPPDCERRLATTPGIKWPGYRPDAERYYHAIDVLVLPTYREGLSRVLLEGAAAGKAIVSTQVTGVIDVVEHEQTGLLVPPRDVPALAAAMLRLASDPGLAAALGERAAEAVWTRFNIEQFHAQLRALYESLADPAAVAR